MRVLTLLLLAVIVGVQAKAADAQCPNSTTPSSAPAAPIAVGLGGQWVTGKASVFDLGRRVQESEVTSRLVVCNMTSKPVELDVFTFGDNIFAVWENSADLKTRAKIEAGQSTAINLKLFTDQKYVEPVITVSRAGQVVMSIFVHYLVTDQTEKTRNVDFGSLQSGFSDKWSPWYQICAGEAPVGYTLNPDKPATLILDGSGGHGRRCGYWSQCRVDQQDNKDVCFGFTVQGHHFGANLFHGDEDEFVNVDAHLKVNYVLSYTEPKLVPLELKGPTAGQAASPAGHN